MAAPTLPAARHTGTSFVYCFAIGITASTLLVPPAAAHAGDGD
jgi:hypothetical protein